jgi:hypothetical protein
MEQGGLTCSEMWPSRSSPTGPCTALSQGKSPCYSFDEAGCVPEPVSTLWKRENPLAPAGNRTPIPRQEFNTLTSVVKVSSTIALLIGMSEFTGCCWTYVNVDVEVLEHLFLRAGPKLFFIQLCSCCTFIEKSVMRLFLQFSFGVQLWRSQRLRSHRKSAVTERRASTWVFVL